MKIINVILSGTIGPPNKERKLTKDDVWGKYDEETSAMIHPGMIVARTGEKCPIWKRTIPYKSVTVICNQEQVEEVEYWLSYVHGRDCIARTKVLSDGRVAIRSNYMCW